MFWGSPRQAFAIDAWQADSGSGRVNDGGHASKCAGALLHNISSQLVPRTSSCGLTSTLSGEFASTLISTNCTHMMEVNHEGKFGTLLQEGRSMPMQW